MALSACRTGLGKEVEVEGLIALARDFMYAGAKRIIVDLETETMESAVLLGRLRPAGRVEIAMSASISQKEDGSSPVVTTVSARRMEITLCFAFRPRLRLPPHCF